MKVKECLIRLYEAIYIRVRRWCFDLRYRFSVLSSEETIRFIKRTNCSIARFGDGEFGLITGGRKPSFQAENAALAHCLREVCRSRDPRLLVCLPHNFKTTDDCNEFARKFWDWWLWDNDNLKKAAKCLGLSPWKKRVFGDAQITRPYMDWKDKSSAAKRFEELKSLWLERRVLIVEGEKTRLGVGNDLFAKAVEVRRIVCPAKNAFDRYEKILSAVERYGKDRLILLALGPTATVLAYDLARADFQALDIGHIDIEYEWFRMGAISKVPIPGKFTQETHTDVENIPFDPAYEAQILLRIDG